MNCLSSDQSEEICLTVSNFETDTRKLLYDDSVWLPSKARSEANTKEPLISVIMTHYNCVKYLILSISSILSQTWKNIELIVIDDCSTEDKDEVNLILDHFSKVDWRVRVLKNTRNVGCYISKNIGIYRAKGEYITFQDADDFSLETRLEKQLLYCQKHKVYICYAKFLCRTTKLLKIAEITCFAHRNSFINIFGCFDSSRIGADSELRYRAHMQLKYGVIDEYLYSCIDKWVEKYGIRLSSLTQCKETSISSNLRQQYRTLYEKSAYKKYSLYQKIHFDEMKNTLPESLLYKLFPKEEDVMTVLKDYKFNT